MPDFRVEAPVTELERFSTDKGSFVVYEIGFSGAEGKGTIRHKRKDSSPAPTPGETLDAEIKQTKDGPELKRVWKQNGSRPSGSKSGADFRTPEQIMRGWAHSHALNYWTLKHGADPTFTFASWGDYLKIVCAFYDDIKGAS